MPNTPKRPDVEAIQARAKQRLNDGVCFTTLEEEQERNNLELIAHIKALEAVVELAPKCHACAGWMPGKCPLCVGYRKALAALGDGDG